MDQPMMKVSATGGAVAWISPHQVTRIVQMSGFSKIYFAGGDHLEVNDEAEAIKRAIDSGATHPY